MCYEVDYTYHSAGCSRFLQVLQRGQIVASMMPLEFRLLLVPSRPPWVEGACRLLEELLVLVLVGVSEKYVSFLECPSSLLLALPSG